KNKDLHDSTPGLLPITRSTPLAPCSPPASRNQQFRLCRRFPLPFRSPDVPMPPDFQSTMFGKARPPLSPVLTYWVEFRRFWQSIPLPPYVSQVIPSGPQQCAGFALLSATIRVHPR